MATEQMNRFEGFYDSASSNDVLDEKTRLMVHLAAAMAFGCEP